MKLGARLALFCFCMLIGAGTAVAKTAPAGKADDMPIDISANDSLEWHRDTGTYYARGAARVVYKGLTIDADELTAHQRPSENSSKTDKNKTPSAQGGSIDQMTAEGHVVIKDEKQQAFGDRAVYDVDAHTFRLTGSNLKYVTEKNTVTAKDSFVFYENENKAVATGRALAVNDGNRIEADTLTAFFTRDNAGQMQMQNMKGQGRVVVLTRDGAIARGDRADYDAQRDVATLYDNVRITRDQTHLAGGMAEVDFKSGESRLLSGGGGRVRVLLPANEAKGGKGGKGGS